jgi:hypothetical protein
MGSKEKVKSKELIDDIFHIKEQNRNNKNYKYEPH